MVSRDDAGNPFLSSETFLISVVLLASCAKSGGHSSIELRAPYEVPFFFSCSFKVQQLMRLATAAGLLLLSLLLHVHLLEAARYYFCALCTPCFLGAARLTL
jgi:hypothetical protein